MVPSRHVYLKLYMRAGNVSVDKLRPFISKLRLTVNTNIEEIDIDLNLLGEHIFDRIVDIESFHVRSPDSLMSRFCECVPHNSF